jgi:predicted acyltransferase
MRLSSPDLFRTTNRLTSLDVFRGIAIAGMILVNKASLGDKVYPQLNHADWNGLTLADLVFPFFLFVVGVAMAFSLAKYTQGDATPTLKVYWRIFSRCLILFGLGLLLNGFWNYDFSTIRIMGVLQRISLSYFISSLIILNVPRKGQWFVAGGLLIGYWLLMSFVPVPGFGAGVLTRDGNFGAYIDRLIIGTAHLYKGDGFKNMGDPEGLFATLPAIASVLLGYFIGQWLRDRRPDSKVSMSMVLWGLSYLVAGQLWDFWFPINKKLWTSSYVLLTTGCALLVLAACYELIEVRKRKEWSNPLEVLGLNPIVVFVGSVLVIKLLAKTQVGTGKDAPSTYAWINQTFFQSWAGSLNGPFLFSIITLLFWFFVAYVMYRQRWFLKV